MNNELIVNNKNVNAIVEKSSMAGVLARTNLEFSTITEKKIAKISENMVEVDRAVKSFGKSNTQVTSKLMSLTMLSAYSPYHTIKQILAQIEKKRGALSESTFGLRKKNVEIKMLKKRISEEEDPLKVEMFYIEIEEIQSNASTSMAYIEAALKEIGSYQNSYKEICKSNNIPEDWDELDMERGEVEHHLKSMFRNGVRDVLASGRLGMGTMEYMEQFGVNPAYALPLISGYVKKCNDKGVGGGEPSFTDLMDFLDACSVKFKDSHKEVMNRIGLKTLIDDEWVFQDKQLEHK